MDDDILMQMAEQAATSARCADVTVNLFFWQRVMKEIAELRHKNEVLTEAVYGDDRRRAPAKLWPAGKDDD